MKLWVNKTQEPNAFAHAGSRMSVQNRLSIFRRVMDDEDNPEHVLGYFKARLKEMPGVKKWEAAPSLNQPSLRS